MPDIIPSASGGEQRPTRKDLFDLGLTVYEIDNVLDKHRAEVLREAADRLSALNHTEAAGLLRRMAEGGAA
ncbi:hypothetical protein ABZ547_08575 [Streptomyces sparsogenes]|uniref:hypothetical protein n=1 Tax=Streptomyces sparsogenes TaxID=67365 RepID=UPI0033CC1188